MFRGDSGNQLIGALEKSVGFHKWIFIITNLIYIGALFWFDSFVGKFNLEFSKTPFIWFGLFLAGFEYLLYRWMNGVRVNFQEWQDQRDAALEVSDDVETAQEGDELRQPEL